MYANVMQLGACWSHGEPMPTECDAAAEFAVTPEAGAPFRAYGSSYVVIEPAWIAQRRRDGQER